MLIVTTFPKASLNAGDTIHISGSLTYDADGELIEYEAVSSLSKAETPEKEEPLSYKYVRILK